MSLHGKHFIGAELVATGDSAFQAVDPRSGEELPTSFYEATVKEADRAMELAEQSASALAASSTSKRVELLRRIADNLESLGDELLERAHAETALPMARLTGERARTVGQTRLFAALIEEGSWVDARIDTAQPDRQPLPKPDVRKMLRPIGPTVVFGASNFPLAISVAGSDTISAFAAGCPVVVKAHPGHPGTSELIASAIAQALSDTGLPAGAFSLVHGASHELGLALVEHPVTRVVAFTGSLAGGRALFSAAQNRPNPIPVYAEMGSVNPMFLMPGALADHPEQIAKQYVTSLNMGVGQFCTNPGVVLAIQGDGYEAFKEAVTKGIEQTPPASMLHPGICQRYASGVERLESAAQVTTIARSQNEANVAKAEASCHLFEVGAEQFLANPSLQEEIFGPCGLLVRCDSTDKFLRAVEEMVGSLTATVHALPGELQADAPLLQSLEQKVGRIIFNGVPTGIEVCSAMHHGGPYPATTHEGYTSIGTDSILRFSKPVCYQDWSDDLLPAELQDSNPLGIWRLVDGERTRAGLSG